MGEIIVDFYAGIGYFMVPWLKYGTIPHYLTHLSSPEINPMPIPVQYVYACEWNPISIQCLFHNLYCNNIDSSRYTIILFDLVLLKFRSLTNLNDYNLITYLFLIHICRGGL
jgi:tRNA G37 N-methylase Trm5